MAQPISNWSGSVRFTPAHIYTPADESELKALVTASLRSQTPMRVVGAGHSFTPLIATPGSLISLDGLQGACPAPPDVPGTRVWAGTRLKALGDLLHSQGQAQENLGDINVQSIAGAFSTGTHGTGTSLGIIATQVTGIRLLTGRGDIVELDATRTPEMFRAAQVSLGALGIITQVSLRTLPTYKLHYRAAKAQLDAVLDSLDTWKQHRHFEFYWFPHTDTVQTKVMNMTEEAPRGNAGFGRWFNDEVLENGAFGLLSTLSKWFPFATRPVARISAAAVSTADRIGWSHEIYATPRRVRFQEMEYNLPADAMAPVLREIRDYIRREKVRVHFPLECRFAKGDDIWLSPAHGRDSAYIAVHQYRGMAHEAYFAAVEAIFRKYDGRPHWGKMHTRTAADLRPQYPRWDDFQAMRRELDPQGIFQNDHLRRVLG